jgi:transcriptional regulator with XRE-family HTH domain
MRKSIHRAEYQILVEMLRESREQAGVTQAGLSKALGRSQSFVSDVERGQRRLDIIELRDICRCLKLDFLGVVSNLEHQLRSSASSAVRRRKSR